MSSSHRWWWCRLKIQFNHFGSALVSQNVHFSYSIRADISHVHRKCTRDRIQYIYTNVCLVRPLPDMTINLSHAAPTNNNNYCYIEFVADVELNELSVPSSFARMPAAERMSAARKMCVWFMNKKWTQFDKWIYVSGNEVEHSRSPTHTHTHTTHTHAALRHFHIVLRNPHPMVKCKFAVCVHTMDARCTCANLE